MFKSIKWYHQKNINEKNRKLQSNIIKLEYYD